nr:immunoglobulin light chain junction region [Macaca mulatta]MOV86327.1 immunoglobulin light chain junction region [Macaca mulatta]
CQQRNSYPYVYSF